MTPNKEKAIEDFRIFSILMATKLHSKAHKLAVAIVRRRPGTNCHYEARDLLETTCFQRTYISPELAEKLVRSVETTLIGQEIYDPDMPAPDDNLPDEKVAPYWVDDEHTEMCEYVDVIVKIAKTLLTQHNVDACVPQYFAVIDPDTKMFTACPWHYDCRIQSCPFRRLDYVGT